MNTHLQIINEISALQIDAKIEDVQLFFNELTYSHFPVLKDGIYLGSIAEADIRNTEVEITLKDLQYSLEGFYVRNDANWLDILESFAQNSSNIMPVLDHDNTYLGYFELNDIMHLFNDTPFLNEPGDILILEKGLSDYSFSEISQIIESNNAKILGLFISQIENDIAQVTVKLGNSDINNIIQTFRRYGYNLISQHQEDAFLTDLKERSEYLKKYLDM